MILIDYIVDSIQIITIVAIPLFASVIFVSKSRKRYTTLDEQGDDIAWLFISHLLVTAVLMIVDKIFN